MTSQITLLDAGRFYYDAVLSGVIDSAQPANRVFFPDESSGATEVLPRLFQISDNPLEQRRIVAQLAFEPGLLSPKLLGDATILVAEQRKSAIGIAFVPLETQAAGLVHRFNIPQAPSPSPNDVLMIFAALHGTRLAAGLAAFLENQGLLIQAACLLQWNVLAASFLGNDAKSEQPELDDLASIYDRMGHSHAAQIFRATSTACARQAEGFDAPLFRFDSCDQKSQNLLAAVIAGPTIERARLQKEVDDLQVELKQVIASLEADKLWGAIIHAVLNRYSNPLEDAPPYLI